LFVSNRKKLPFVFFCLLIIFSQEQIYEFYEKLRTTSSESIEDFQSILEVFISDIMKYRKDIQRLEESFRR